MITTLISATAIILSAFISGICSWIITKKTTLNGINYDKRKNRIYLCDYASIVRLDIATALFLSIRTLKKFNENKIDEIHPLPFNKNYAKAMAVISDSFTLKEISHLYQIYGIIEKINKGTIELSEKKKEKLLDVKRDYKMLLNKVYNNEDEFAKIIDIEKVSYIEVIDNEFIKEEYRNTFLKLNKICCDRNDEVNTIK